MNTQNTFLDRYMCHYHNAAVFLDGLSKDLLALSKSYKMSHMLYSVILHINHVPFVEISPDIGTDLGSFDLSGHILNKYARNCAPEMVPFSDFFLQIPT